MICGVCEEEHSSSDIEVLDSGFEDGVYFVSYKCLITGVEFDVISRSKDILPVDEEGKNG